MLKLISLHSHYAEMIRLGYKTIETRGWKTSYRGLIAIHKTIGECAVKNCAPFTHFLTQANWIASETAQGLYKKKLMQFWHDCNRDRGCIVAIANLTDCQLMTSEMCADLTAAGISRGNQICGIWQPGRYALTLENIQILPEPVKIPRGSQGRPIPLENSVCEKILAQLPALSAINQ